jgi:heme-degrading monooxygenase HmoA
MPHKVVAVYTVKPSASEEEVDRSREVLEVFRGQPGLVSYEVVRTGPGGVVVIHEWQTKADYARAVAEAAGRMAGREAIVLSREVFAGEVVLVSE